MSQTKVLSNSFCLNIFFSYSYSDLYLKLIEKDPNANIENENSVKKTRGRPPKSSNEHSSKSQENTNKNSSVLVDNSLHSNDMETSGIEF